MTAFASTDVTVSVNQRNRDVFSGTKQFVMGTIAFGDGALEYATGGVPLPAVGNFGMRKALDKLAILDPSGSLFWYRYDSTNHKIKILTITAGALAELAAAQTPAATTLEFIAIGE